MKTKWTLIKVQEESKRIHGDIFILSNLHIDTVGNKGRKQSYIDIFCKICNFKNTVSINHHINSKRGCVGLCRHTINRKIKIQ